MPYLGKIYEVREEMMKVILKTLGVLLMLFGTSVFASALTEPKNSGIIGERFDGYIGIVEGATPDIKSLVNSVNEKRKARYKEIAMKRQQALKKVELIAGESAIKKTSKGNYIFLKGVGWKQK